VEPNDENIRRWILQVLYTESNTLEEIKHVSLMRLSEILEVPITKIKENINYLYGIDFILQKDNEFKLTEKAIWAIRQHERTYCPYL